VRRFLAGLGWRVEAQPFSFSPLALDAFPLFGAGLGAVALMQFPVVVLPGLAAYAALVMLVVSLGGLAGMCWLIGAGVRIPGAEIREDANLVATRAGVEQVRRWIVAHLDSKAQGQSMAGRLWAVWCAAIAVTGLIAIAVARLCLARPLPPSWLLPGLGLSVVAGALAGRGRLRGGSPGARDNGTGVLALLEAAAIIRDPAVGLLVTGAEEFGLVGGRIFAASRSVSGLDVINLDTLTDRGRLYLVVHDGAGRGLAEQVVRGMGQAAEGGVVRRLPAGILTDSLPFARRGARAITLARLDWSVLRLIHTPRDTPAGLDLQTAAGVGRALGVLPLSD
jgi:peptidase M28-like protein